MGAAPASLFLSFVAALAQAMPQLLKKPKLRLPAARRPPRAPLALPLRGISSSKRRSASAQEAARRKCLKAARSSEGSFQSLQRGRSRLEGAASRREGRRELWRWCFSRASLQQRLRTGYIALECFLHPLQPLLELAGGAAVAPQPSGRPWEAPLLRGAQR